MTNDQEGATPSTKPELKPGECAHKFIWVWHGNNWTDTVQCIRCGVIRENKGLNDHV